jgi:cell division protein FtsZ
MGVGRAAGKGKAEEAARMAVQSPLLETSINGSKGVLVNVTGSMDLALEDVEIAANLVQQAAHPDANIIFGASFDDSLEDELRITVIATNFDPDSDVTENLYSGAKNIVPQSETVKTASNASTETIDEEEDPFDKIFQIFNKK